LARDAEASAFVSTKGIMNSQNPLNVKLEFFSARACVILVEMTYFKMSMAHQPMYNSHWSSIIP